MDLADVELEVLDRLKDQRGLDRGGVRREALQGASESVIIELLDGQVEIVGQGGGLGPFANAEKGLGPEQSVGDEDLDQGAEGDLALPGDESVDGGSEVELLEVVDDGGQGADALDLVWV